MKRKKRILIFAVKAARSAFESGPWAEMATAERAHLIYKLADLIEEHREELAQLEALDNGKPYQVALDDDISATVENYRYYAGWATKIIGQTIPISKDYLNYTRHEPVGVVGQIIPWNFPLVMSSWKMGCTGDRLYDCIKASRANAFIFTIYSETL